MFSSGLHEHVLNRSLEYTYLDSSAFGDGFGRLDVPLSEEVVDHISRKILILVDWLPE